MKIVICGAGVIGAAIACYLARRGVAATLVEHTGVAAAASGKSGGFIARDWCNGQPQAELARLSFALHQELAESLDGDHGYRAMHTLSVAASERRDLSAHGRGRVPDWLSPECALSGIIGEPAERTGNRPCHE